MESSQPVSEDTVVYGCSHCGGMNRILRSRLGDDPVCGRCKEKVFPRRPVTITDASWKKEVEDSPIPVLVDFWAPWCGPCRTLGPILERAAPQLAPAIRVAKLNIDEAQGLAGRLNVSAVPTMAVFRNGRLERASLGAKPRPQLEAELGMLVIP